MVEDIPAGRRVTYGELVGENVRNVTTIFVDVRVDAHDSSSESQTGETLELGEDGWASELELSLVERLVLAVDARVHHLEPDLVALAAESRRDVGAVAVVVVAVEDGVSVVSALDGDGELVVRCKAVVWEAVEFGKHAGVGGELEDEVARVARSFHLLAGLLGGVEVQAEDVGDIRAE